MRKYIYLFLLLLVICTPAIAGTIHSYTEKNPPDSADEFVIYDSDDGSTKKVQIGNIPSSGSSSGINWTAYPDLTALTNAQEFLVNNGGTSSSINWEVFQAQLPSGTSSGWEDAGTTVSTITSTDSVGIGTANPTQKLELAGGSFNIKGSGSTSSLFLNNVWSAYYDNITNPGGSGSLAYYVNRPVTANSAMRFALFPNGTVGGTSNSMIAGIKIFQNDTAADLTDSCDFGMYMTSSGMRFNTKANGTCTPFPINWSHQDSIIDMTLDTGGNLGIGTVNPVGKLGITQATDTSSGGISVYNSTAASNLRIWAKSGSTGASIDSGVNGNSTLILNAGTGNIGMGSTTPNAKLDIATGTSQLVKILSTQTGSTGGSVLQLGMDSGAAVATANRIASIQAVGASDALNTLNVATSLDFITREAFSGSASGTDLRIRSTPVGSATLAETFRFTADGNLGIGTASPTQKLQVIGTIRATAFQSSDGSAGVTGSTCSAWKNGLCTSL